MLVLGVLWQSLFVWVRGEMCYSPKPLQVLFVCLFLASYITHNFVLHGCNTKLFQHLFTKDEIGWIWEGTRENRWDNWEKQKLAFILKMNPAKTTHPMGYWYVWRLRVSLWLHCHTEPILQHCFHVIKKVGAGQDWLWGTAAWAAQWVESSDYFCRMCPMGFILPWQDVPHINSLLP